MRRFILCAVLLIFSVSAIAQNNFICRIKDSKTGKVLAGVSVTYLKTGAGIASDSAGKSILKNIPDGRHEIKFSAVGYYELIQSYIFPMPPSDTTLEVFLTIQEHELDQVIISSSRTNSRLENLPTKVEVIGEEEMEEENGIKPGNIASILGDIAGIQMQQTSAATGNTDMRIQGLQGKYTQILRDGLPLFGGYSGSFSILQIPPLDLKQVELIKGAASTLYGGGAIAGMINLVSKTPKRDFERSITLNQSTLKETNANVFFSHRKEKFGYTFFAGGNYQYAVDVNNDGFSDVPDVKTVFVHPRLFFYIDSFNTVNLGYTLTAENRNGGDMQVLHANKDASHQFFIRNKTLRNTADAEWEKRSRGNGRFILKGTTSWFDRNVETNVFGMKADQFSWYSEASYNTRINKNNIVAGLNFTGENFKKKEPDSTLIENYNYSTMGAFAQDDWSISSKMTLQGGLRFDHHNRYGNFFLPRLSLLYKISSVLTSRVGGGLGYKIPTVFNSDIDERDYPLLLPLGDATAEKSYGLNADINYKKNFNDLSLTLNQAFYYTKINDPIIYDTTVTGYIKFNNASKPLTTYGFETYVQAHYKALEVYLGYVYTVAKKTYDPVQPYLSLSARHKFASVIAYEFSSNFRAGIESALTGHQYLDDGRKTPSYLFVAAMVRYDVGIISFVLNCENLLDYRQTRNESILIPPIENPRFTQLWAPIDGRVVNLSVRFKW